MRNLSENTLPLLLAIAICLLLLARNLSGGSPVPTAQTPQPDAKTQAASERPPRGKMVGIPPQTHLYPMPMSIVGAHVNGRPNFLAIAYVGAGCYDPPMLVIGINKKHYTTEGILANKTFSVNIPSQDMLGITDYVGMVSGRDVDKPKLFEVFYGKLETAPLIRDAALAMECEVLEVLDLGGTNYTVVGKVVATWVDENVLTRGVPDLSKIDPILFSMFENRYWRLGAPAGKAWHDGADYARRQGLPEPKAQGH